MRPGYREFFNTSSGFLGRCVDASPALSVCTRSFCHLPLRPSFALCGYFSGSHPLSHLSCCLISSRLSALAQFPGFGFTPQQSNIPLSPRPRTAYLRWFCTITYRHPSEWLSPHFLSLSEVISRPAGCLRYLYKPLSPTFWATFLHELLHSPFNYHLRTSSLKHPAFLL